MLNKSNIEEANKHLQALYGRVHELECVVKDQHEALLSKDSFIQTKVAELSYQDNVIQEHRLKLEENDLKLMQAEQRIQSLELALNEKESDLEILRKRNEMLTKLLNLIPEMRVVWSKMENIAVAVDEMDGGQGDLTDSQTSAADGDATDNIHDVPDNVILKIHGSPEAAVTVKQDMCDSPDLLEEKDGVFNEMARNMSKREGLKKFSISEDDEVESSATAQQTPSTDDKTRLKEIYF